MDNFNNLWNGLKAQIIEARQYRKEYRAGCEVECQGACDGRVRIGRHTSGDKRALVSIKSGLMNEMHATLTPEQLKQHAAHCLAAAMEIEEANMPADFNASAHGHLVIERAPVDDEQP